MDSPDIVAGAQMNLFDLLELIASVISIASVLGLLANLLTRLKRGSPKMAVHEFVLLLRQPWHIVIGLVILLSTAYLVAVPPTNFPLSLLILVPVGAGCILMLSLFVAQARQVSGTVVINEMWRLSRIAECQPGKLCTAIRFDIDRLKAISNYSKSVGEQIRDVVRETIAEEVLRMRNREFEVSAVEIPGEDETFVIMVGLSVDQAADVADEIRRRMRGQIMQIPYYKDAVNFVVDRLNAPPSLHEERQGIGTVSAGVAAYRSTAGQFLSDVSTAVKESKTQGRNKTVIYRPGSHSEIRSDYDPAAPEIPPDTGAGTL